MTEERKKAGKINAFSVPQERALFTEKFSLDISKGCSFVLCLPIDYLEIISQLQGFLLLCVSEAVSLVEKLHLRHNSVFSNTVLSDFLFVFFDDLAVGRALLSHVSWQYRFCS